MNLNFSKTFNFFSQECFLAKNSILSGFDFLLQTRLNEEKDGYFYSAFFQLSIGIERILKIVIIADYMIDNDFSPPSETELRKYGHDISNLYTKCTEINNKYSLKEFISPKKDSEELMILSFLNNYNKTTRYYNLNQLSTPKFIPEKEQKSPIAEWCRISDCVIRDELTLKQWQKIEEHGQNILYNLDRNVFTSELDFDGQVMTSFDVIWRRMIYEKSIPYTTWRLIALLKPTYYLMKGISEKAGEIENEKGLTTMAIPCLEEFFYFLLANRSVSLRRKRWLYIFNR